MRLKSLGFISVLLFASLLLLPTPAGAQEPLSQPSLSFEPDEYYPPPIVACNNLEIEIKMDNDPECAPVEYVSLTAVVNDPTLELIEFIGTAHIRIGAWESDVAGTSEMINFVWEPWFTLADGPYPSVTWTTDQSLPGGESLYITIEVHCIAPGDVIMKVFPRATEDHGPPILDEKNIWTPDGIDYYPVHNSYDNWDDDINSGHSWEPNSWTRKYNPSDMAYAKVSIYITQGAVPEFLLGTYIPISIGAAAYFLIPKIMRRKKKEL